jgi:hypothetical protein
VKATDDCNARPAHQAGEIVGPQNHVARTFLGADEGKLFAAKQVFVAEQVGCAVDCFYSLRPPGFRI